MFVNFALFALFHSKKYQRPGKFGIYTSLALWEKITSLTQSVAFIEGVTRFNV